MTMMVHVECQWRRHAMRPLKLLVLIMVLAGCASQPQDSPDFVQGKIRIVPPVTRLLGAPAIGDGGTMVVPIRDTDGKERTLFIDHRMESPTPGAIYLNAYPGEHGSVRVHDTAEFKRKVGDFDYH